jgi:hexosaminidase
MVHSVRNMTASSLRRPGALRIACVILAGCLASLPATAADPAPPAVIPAPASFVARSGSLTLDEDAVLAAEGGAEAQRIARQFAARVEQIGGPRLQVVARRDAGANRAKLRFSLDANARVATEGGYSLEIDPRGVRLRSREPQGLGNGSVTLWQLIAGAGAADGRVTLPALAIEDAPRSAWRGLMLDSARHYQSPEFIERFIDWMALHKLNVLHWHLTDDQAWRLEIHKYPRLTQVGAWRVPAGPAAAADIDPATGKPRLYGGYYTQDTVRRIVRHAAERGITIVPEIEMPGHATAAIVAYPQLAVDGRAPSAVPADWGIYPNLFNVEDATFSFLEDVLREVIELFPGEYVHVGGDEAVKDQWKASPQVQQRMRERGIANEHALQSYFVQRIGRFLDAQGRRLIGWDEILEGGLAPDATVMSWRGIDGALAAAAAGHDAVLTPWPTLYLDNRQGSGPAEPPGRGRVIDLESVYRFDPMPPAIAPERRRHILGAQANLWTEHIRTEERLQWMAFPRAAALAEVAWSPAARLDYADFRRRLETAFGWYPAVGLEAANSWFAPPVPPQDKLRRSQELRTCSDKLVLNLEDDAPVRGERAVFLVDIMEPCWIYDQADLSGVTAIAASVGQFPFNFQIGKDRDAIRLRTPSTPEGELEVRVDGCDGERIAALPLAPAVASNEVTRLPATKIAPRTGRHDLCLTFTGRDIDPMWAIDAILLVETPGIARRLE